MDLLKNSSKYNDYLQRIREYQEIADNNEAFSVIEVRVNNIYEDLKSSHGKNFYKNIFFAILCLSASISAICFFTSHTMLGIVNLVTLATAKLYYNRSVKSYAADTKKEHDILSASNSFDEKLLQTMKYLENGIDLKSARIIAIRFIYIGLFSVIMFSGATILQIENTTSSVVLYGVSILLNAGFWFYFFKDDLEELEYIAMELNEYLVSFQNSLASKNIRVETERASAQKEVDFYNFDTDETIEVIPSPLPQSDEHREYKQLKLELK